MMEKPSSVPQRGDVVIRDDVAYTVVDVMARLTPFRKKHQDTRVEGYTVGLKRIPMLTEDDDG